MPEEGPPLVSFDQAPEPAPTDAAWGDGWSPQAGAPRPLSDAPVARELFGGSGYEELEDVPPPTEELPSGVMEDVGQSYSTPYSVPASASREVGVSTRKLVSSGPSGTVTRARPVLSDTWLAS